MRSFRNSTLAVGVITAALLLVGLPAQAATTEVDSTEAEFSEFVELLAVSAELDVALQEKFDVLPLEAQKAFLAAPESVFTIGESDTSTAVVSKPSASAVMTTWRVTNNQPVQVLGLTVGNFHLTYTYDATATAVTRNLECFGSWSGFGLSGSSSPSSYISGGRGTCNVRHQMTYLFQGSPFQFTKLHTVTTVAGDPSRVTGSISNV
jgi:hypothetical protein